jgi:hypothetical protein
MTAAESFSAQAIERLTMSSDPWLSCDDCFEQIDALVEECLTGRGPVSLPLQVHLRACTVCREEAHSLVTLVAPEHGLDPARAAVALDAIIDGDQDRP